MSLNPQIFWELNAPWRDGDAAGAVEILRPLVDQFPDVLEARLLLAGFATRAGNIPQALLQYEKLLVLAVGQGDLLQAIAAQCSLDALNEASERHRKRFPAMQQWFRSLPARRSKQARPGGLPIALLVGLPPTEFRRMAEGCTVEILGPEVEPWTGVEKTMAVLLHGRARWTFEPSDEAALPTITAEAGDLIVAPDGCGAGDRLRVEPDSPCVVLRFPEAAVVTLRELLRKEHKAGEAKRSGRGKDAAKSPPAASRSSAKTPAARPTLDRETEQLAAADPHEERRGHHEMIAFFDGGNVSLGLAGTRTTPIPGRLLDFSPAGFVVALPRAVLRQSRAAIEGAVVTVRIVVRGEPEPLEVSARVARFGFDLAPVPGINGPVAQLALDFVLLLAHDRARLQGAMIEAARTGRWLGAHAPDGNPLDSRPRAA
jgi:hypothetical protein